MATAIADLAPAHRGFPYSGPTERRCSVSPRGYQHLPIESSHYVHGIVRISSPLSVFDDLD